MPYWKLRLYHNTGDRARRFFPRNRTTNAQLSIELVLFAFLPSFISFRCVTRARNSDYSSHSVRLCIFSSQSFRFFLFYLVLSDSVFFLSLLIPLAMPSLYFVVGLGLMLFDPLLFPLTFSNYCFESSISLHSTLASLSLFPSLSVHIVCAVPSFLPNRLTFRFEMCAYECVSVCVGEDRFGNYRTKTTVCVRMKRHHSHHYIQTH